MEIALIHNKQLILGPMPFNMRMINSELNDLELPDLVSIRSYEELPIHFSDNLTHLLPIEKVIPPYDFKYHKIEDFTWEIVLNNNIPVKVLFTYPLIERTINEIKEERKNEVSSIRKQKENKTISVNVNGTSVEVYTSREERQILSSKLSASPEPHIFKFKNTWLNITEEDLQHIIKEVDNSIQEVFNWEFNKFQEIDSCKTIDEVYKVEI